MFRELSGGDSVRSLSDVSGQHLLSRQFAAATTIGTLAAFRVPQRGGVLLLRYFGAAA